MTRRWLSLLAPLSLLGLLAACATETIVVGEVPATDAGPQAPPPSRCVDTCASGYYCALPSCGATSGTCLPPPQSCDATEAPVCGCDGLTYFNDCWRQAFGVSASTPGPCGQGGVFCGGPNDPACPTGALCAQLGSPHDGCHEVLGTCWVLPPHCPTTVPTNAWDSCSPTGGVCVSTCDAIKAGGAYRRSESCP
jgi:hypothetical protein